jgi:predicted dinucleotide-binding enzyme
MTKKKIGILGSGQVAQVLGTGFLQHGYEVMLGTRSAMKLDEWKSKHSGKGKVGSFHEAASFGEIMVLAVKGMIAESLVLKLRTAISGKTVIDTSNPIAEAPPENGVLKYFTAQNESLMEKLQRAVPDAHFVKAFNSVGNRQMVNPVFQEGKPTMFIAGNDESARTEVSIILDEFGWDVTDLGKAEAARPIESLCMLWCIPGFIQNQWTHAFKLLKE